MNCLGKSITLLFFISTLNLISVNVAATQIPIDIVEALMSYSSKTKLKLGIANTDFPKFDLGNDIILYGNTKLDTFGRKSAMNFYTSTLNETALENKIKNLLAANDWRIPKHFAGRMNTGFKLKSRKDFYKSILPYCHKKLGNITVSIVAIKAGSFAKLSHTPHGKKSMKCERHRPSEARFMSALEELPMPELELPEQQVSNNLGAMGISGGSSGRGRRSTEATIASTMGIGDIYQHFVPQLIQQGWSQDSNWIGSITAGGHWVAVKDDKHYVVGITIIRENEDTASMQMWIKKQG